jgi:hypothetical protein
MRSARSALVRAKLSRARRKFDASQADSERPEGTCHADDNDGVPDPRPVPSRFSHEREQARLRISLLWLLVMLVVFAASVYGAALGGAYLGRHVLPQLDGGRQVSAMPTIGAVLGALVAAIVCQRARSWLQRLRLWLLRGESISANATVVGLDSLYTKGSRGNGNTLHIVHVKWRDATGEHIGERQYKFYNHGPADFLTRMQRGAHLPIRYHPARPHRFIIDIPYAPRMADNFI